MNKKLAMGAMAGVGLAGAGVLAPGAPVSAAPICGGTYSMSGALGSYQYGTVFDSSSSCNGNSDVEFASVSRTTYYVAIYQNGAGQWVGADVNDMNSGWGPQLTAGAQNPWKKMITNLTSGRGVYMGARGSLDATGTVYS